MKRLLFILSILPAFAFGQQYDTIVKNAGLQTKNHVHEWKCREPKQIQRAKGAANMPAYMRICATCHRLEVVQKRRDTTGLDEFGKVYLEYLKTKEQDETNINARTIK